MAAVILFGDRSRLDALKNEVMRKGDCSFALYDEPAAATKDIEGRSRLALVVIETTSETVSEPVKKAAEAKGVAMMVVDGTDEEQRNAVIQQLKGGT